MFNNLPNRVYSMATARAFLEPKLIGTRHKKFAVSG